MDPYDVFKTTKALVTAVGCSKNRSYCFLRCPSTYFCSFLALMRNILRICIGKIQKFRLEQEMQHI